MTNGWLIVNGYLEDKKFDEIYEWLILAAKNQGCNLRKITNDQMTAQVQIDSQKIDWKTKPDFVLFWDKDIKLARLLEATGLRLFNNSSAIELCDDKALTFISLKNSGIKTPKTFMSPITFENEYSDFAFLLNVESVLGFPFVIKANKGSFGAQVYLVKNHKEALEAVKNVGCEFIMQEYIESSKGKDIRLNVVGDKVVAAMMRHNKNDFRANITNGGRMEKFIPNEAQKKMAVDVCKALNLDFGGVDILFDGNGEAILCEVNSNAHFKNIFDCTGVNAADYIIKYILRKVQES